ncbi:MAG: hypothetical protein U5O39_09920 [Gammaproteobacteria bacterium]|nr:hypothetical protein [Gammaproteobacteria bacterium]
MADRLASRVQLATDGGRRPYLEAVERAFGNDIDYARLIRIYGTDKSLDADKRYSPAVCTGTETRVVTGDPDIDHVSDQLRRAPEPDHEECPCVGLPA